MEQNDANTKQVNIKLYTQKNQHNIEINNKKRVKIKKKLYVNIEKKYENIVYELNTEHKGIKN